MDHIAEDNNSGAFTSTRHVTQCVTGLCGQRAEDHEGKREQSQQHPALCHPPHIDDGLVRDY